MESVRSTLPADAVVVGVLGALPDSAFPQVAEPLVLREGAEFVVLASTHVAGLPGDPDAPRYTLAELEELARDGEAILFHEPFLQFRRDHVVYFGPEGAGPEYISESQALDALREFAAVRRKAGDRAAREGHRSAAADEYLLALQTSHEACDYARWLVVGTDPSMRDDLEMLIREQGLIPEVVVAKVREELGLKPDPPAPFTFGLQPARAAAWK